MPFPKIFNFLRSQRLPRLLAYSGFTLLAVFIAYAYVRSDEGTYAGLGEGFRVRKLKELPHGTGVSAAAWSLDGKRVATLSSMFSKVTVWDSDSGIKFREFDITKSWPACNTLAFTPDGENILAVKGIEVGAGAALWNISSGEIARSIAGPFTGKDDPRSNNVDVLAISPNGTEIALGLVSVGAPLTLYFEESSVSTKISVGWDTVISLSFSPNSRQLAVGTIAGRLYFLDTRERRIVRKIQVYEEDTGGVGSITFSPDGHLIASGSGGSMHSERQLDGTWKRIVTKHPLVILDADNGRVISNVRGETDRIWSVSWSYDGQILASAEGDKRVHFRRAERLNESDKSMALDGAAMSVAFAPNSLKFVAAGGDSAVIGEAQFP
jgi:WD40 repeat protein